MKKKALFVGVNDYKDDEIRNLHYALDDARSLHDIFEELGYKTAFLKNPGQGEILSQVRKMIEELSVGDQFVFYFSGHGFTDDGQHLLFCVDDVYANLRYKRAGMPFELLEEETRKCGCDRVFMLDACRSDFLTGTRGADTTTKDLCPISHMVPKGADAIGAFYVLRSCSRYEHAFEIDKKQHGLFTLAMMEVIRESKNTGSQLLFNDMLRETVEERMSQIARNVGLSVVQTPESEVRGRAQILINGRNGFTGVSSHSVPSLVTCPICGKRNKIEDTFKCRQCGSDNLCLRHQDEKTFLCGNCSDEKRKSVKSAPSPQSMSAKDAYERGENYYYGRNGFGQDYAEAVKWYRKSAEQGYACAQNDLGLMYKNGRGVTKDDSEAVKWYRKAAEQGHARAQCVLGFMYMNGRGVTQDDSEAVKWYRKSAEQGESDAQINLGFMYMKGRGVTKDESEAVKWYCKAAEQGDASAECWLGFMFEKGRGVTQDDSEAVKWYRKSAAQGNEKAKEFLKVIEKRIAEGSRNAAKLNVLQPNTAVNTVKRVQLWKDGPYWADRNIGAENPWDSGYYFWWGDTIGYKRVNDKWVASDGSVSNLGKLGNVPTEGKRICELYNAGWIELFKKRWLVKEYVLASKYDPAQKHWSGNWRMPTLQEWEDINSKCDWLWTTVNGVNGYVVRGKGDYSSAEIFLPSAGFGIGTSLRNAGRYGYYWSSVPGSGGSWAWCLYFHSSSHGTGGSGRYDWNSVRPLQGFMK